MNGRLDKVAMTNKLMQLKEKYIINVRWRKIRYCQGANDYLNRVLDVLDEYWQ
ncbi:MAG: hypothetical protein CM15mV22_0580 [Eurybiavirus sp.]|nr:MAG: hypothetical protein CM15mV22_0580 [Eurybiavirus sp.]